MQKRNDRLAVRLDICLSIGLYLHGVGHGGGGPSSRHDGRGTRWVAESRGGQGRIGGVQ